MDNGKDIDNNGMPKTSAWRWLVKELGAVFVGIFIVVPLLLINWWGKTEMIILFVAAGLIVLWVAISTPSWYRTLVSDNIIKPFERSKFSEIFTNKNKSEDNE